MLEKLNVLFLSHVPTMLGANRSLLNLISGLEEKINCTVILPAEGAFKEELDRRKIRSIVISFKHTSVKKYLGIKNIFFFLPRYLMVKLCNQYAEDSIVKLISKEKFDIIHSNSGVITIGQSLSKRLSIPHVWHLREFQDLDYNLEYLLGKNEFLKLLGKSESIIAISDSIAKHFRNSANLLVVYNGLFKLNAEEQVKPLLPPSEKPYFLFCGALTHDKGIEDAVLTFSKIKSLYPDIILQVAGDFVDTVYEARIRSLIELAGLNDSVIFLGFVNDVSLLMQNSLALLMCSHNEALGRVTIEAMYNGCLVIGFDSAGTGELIEDGVNGLLYTTLIQFQELLLCAIESPDLCNRIKQDAVKFARQNFSEEVYSQKVFDIYKSLNI